MLNLVSNVYKSEYLGIWGFLLKLSSEMLAEKEERHHHEAVFISPFIAAYHSNIKGEHWREFWKIGWLKKKQYKTISEKC